MAVNAAAGEKAMGSMDLVGFPLCLPLSGRPVSQKRLVHFLKAAVESIKSKRCLEE